MSLVWFGASLCAVFGWLVSGRSPFVWGMIACAHGEAARRLAIESLVLAARHFWRQYGSAVEAVRTEFGEA